jgi:hypothetical protein
VILLTKPVRRKVLTARGTLLVLELTPEGVIYREPGRRTRYTLPHGVAFVAAVRLHVAAVNAERIARRKLKRAERAK